MHPPSQLSGTRTEVCIYYRQLNDKTRKDSIPLPRIEKLLDFLTGARRFSTTDLANAYNQVPVAEEDNPRPLLHPHLYYSSGIKCHLDSATPQVHFKDLPFLHGTAAPLATRSGFELALIGGADSNIWGFTSYYCRLVEGFTRLAAPLHQLVAKLGDATVVHGKVCLKYG